MAAKENLMGKSFTQTHGWIAAVTGHSPDCRGRSGHSSEPASTGYCASTGYPVPTALPTLVWSADSAHNS